MDSFSGRVNHFMRTSNPCNFMVSDWEVAQRYKHLGKLQNMLEKNESIEMTKEEKKQYMRSFYMSSGAVKP